MSVKRILGITAFGAAVIAGVLIIMSVISFLRRENSELPLPLTTPPSASESEPSGTGVGLSLVEVTPDTVQDTIRTLSRPHEYMRDIRLESFWDGGSADYNISVAVSGGVTSLRILSGGTEKRIIVTADTLYIWYYGDSEPFTGSPNSTGDAFRSSDEWQMLLTYEDILSLDKETILDAGFIQYAGESCIYVDYTSPLLGYTTRCYVSIDLGIIIAAEEYDGITPVSRMTAGDCTIGESDESFFILPDGTSVKPNAQT